MKINSGESYCLVKYINSDINWDNKVDILDMIAVRNNFDKKEVPELLKLICEILN